jgi:biotin transport system substrate-specific component
VLLWAIIGLLLTIFATFAEVLIANPLEGATGDTLPRLSLGVTYQIGAVLLAACMGGKTAGAAAQIAYLAIGLLWMPVFARGGGISYVFQPSFGYLLGFIPGAWICGWWVFRSVPRIENFAIASLMGLGIVHGVGILYLLALTEFKTGMVLGDLPAMWYQYSVAPLPGQLVVVCMVAVLSWLLRRLLFY